MNVLFDSRFVCFLFPTYIHKWEHVYTSVHHRMIDVYYTICTIKN
jgi:hypothetical protein